MITRRGLILGGLVAAGSMAMPRQAVARVRSARAAAVVDNYTTLYSYGHSFTMDNYPYFTAPYAPRQSEYARRVASTLSVPVSMRGRSGTLLMDTVSAVIAPTFGGYQGRMWVPGTDHGSDVVLLQNVHNDVSSQIGGTDKYMTGYKGAMRLMLGAYGSRRYIGHDEGVKVGAWTTYNSDRVAEGQMAYTTEYGAKISFTVSGDTCHIATLACDDTELNYGTFRIEVNGETVGFTTSEGTMGEKQYFNGTGKMQKYTDSVDDVTLNRWSPYGIRVMGMSTVAGTSGNKTLTIRKVGNDTKPVFVNGVYLTSGTPPRVYVGHEPPRNPEATNQAAVQAFYANNPAYRALVSDLCSQYSYVEAVDLGAGWDNNTMVATGVDPYNFHPNGLGMDRLAKTFLNAIGY